MAWDLHGICMCRCLVDWNIYLFHRSQDSPYTHWYLHIKMLLYHFGLTFKIGGIKYKVVLTIRYGLYNDNTYFINIYYIMLLATWYIHGLQYVQHDNPCGHYLMKLVSYDVFRDALCGVKLPCFPNTCILCKVSGLSWVLYQISKLLVI